MRAKNLDETDDTLIYALGRADFFANGLIFESVNITVFIRDLIKNSLIRSEGMTL